MKKTKGISAFISLVGILFIVSLLVINPLVINKLAGRNLHDYYISNIYHVMWMIGISGLLMIVVGMLGYQRKLLGPVEASPKKLNLVLFLFILLSGFLYIEFLLRIKPELTTTELFDHSVPYEGSIFSRNKLPDDSIVVFYRYLPNKVIYRLNNGYHGQPFEAKKPEGETRIVVLGGSFIFGDHQEAEWEEIESEYNRNWVQKIEEKMHLKGSTNVRIINAGIPDHATFDSFGRLYSEIHLFNPDYVVLCHGWNDIKYFCKVNPENSLLRVFNPKTVKTREELVDILEISQIYLRFKRLIQFNNDGLEGHYIESDGQKAITPYAMKQFELTVDLFVQACKAINSQPVLLTQPRLVHQKNTDAERSRIAYGYQDLDHKGICRAYDYIDSVFLNYPSKDSSVLVHDFARDFIGVDSLFTDHVHLNAKGNEALSSYLAGYFQDIINN